MEGQICIQRGNSRFPEEGPHSRGWRRGPRELSHPEMSKMLRERDHPTQVIFHNHGEVFTPPPAWGSAAWAEPLGLSPPCTGCSSSGEVRVPSPFQQSAADGARYVLQATITRGDSQRWSQQRLPSGGQQRSAKVVALREQLIGFAKPAHPPPRQPRGCQGGRHQRRRSGGARQRATGSSLLECRQRNRPRLHQTPRESSAEQGRHTEGSGGRWGASC